jgi:magnesium-transporting ATPase (P-type)
MVSGDHIDTATAVAIKAGILTEDEAKIKYAVMHADEFRKIVGGMRKEIDKDGNVKHIIQNRKEF